MAASRKDAPDIGEKKADDNSIMQYTRAYLLGLLGTTLFPHTSDKYVDLRWLWYLYDLSNTRAHCWPAAVLAFTYDSLTQYAYKKVVRLGCCIPLLLVWSYERIPVGRPSRIRDTKYDVIPVAIRWMTDNSRMQNDPSHIMPVFRNSLDLLTYDKVTWRPYSRLDQTHVPEGVAMSIIETCHRAPLQALEIIVGYHPDRCLPQFGFRQRIPLPPTVDLPTDTRNAWALRDDDQSPYLIVNVEASHISTDLYPIEYSSWYGLPRVFSTTVRYEEPRFEPAGYREGLYDIYRSRCMEEASAMEELWNDMVADNMPQHYIARVLGSCNRLRAPVPRHFAEADDPTAATQTVPVRGPSDKRWFPKNNASTPQSHHQSTEAVGHSTEHIPSSSEHIPSSSEHIPSSSERWSEPQQWESTETATETDVTVGTSYPWGGPTTSLIMGGGYSSYNEMYTTPPIETDPIAASVFDFFSTPEYAAYGGGASSSQQYAPVQGMRPPRPVPVTPCEYFGYGEESPYSSFGDDLGIVRPSTEQQDRGRTHMQSICPDDLGIVRPSTDQQGQRRTHRQSRRPDNYARYHAHGRDCDTR